MHSVNNHLDKTDHLASDYLNVLITYLRSIPHGPIHLQTIFHQCDETNKNQLDIQQFERLLSILIVEACINSGYDAPQNTELTVSYILNILIQIQINNNINHPSIIMEFSQHFVTHLLEHLLSLKSKEQKITSTPKTNANIQSNQSNIKLKKYKKVSPKLVNNITDNYIMIKSEGHENINRNRFSINRRKTKANRAKRSQSDGANDVISDEYKAYPQNKSRSKSTDLNQNELDHVVLASSPTNSLVMTENVLFKYQKHPTQNPSKHDTTAIKRKYRYNQYGSRLFPPLTREHRNGYHKRSTHTLKTPANINNISIERISHHGNGSPSDSTSKSSKSSKSNRSKYKNTRTATSSKSKSVHSMKSARHNDEEMIKSIKPTPRGVRISRRRTENNLLFISRKDTEYKEPEDEDDITMDINSDHLMLDLLTEISILQKEHKKSKHCYTHRISQLENKLQRVQSENTLMQQTLRLYEQRIAQMERMIATGTAGHANAMERAHSANRYIPNHYNSYYPVQSQPVHMDRYYHHHNGYRPSANTVNTNMNVSVLSTRSSRSTSTSSHSTSSSLSSRRSRSSRRRHSHSHIKSKSKLTRNHHGDAVVIYEDDNEYNKGISISVDGLSREMDGSGFTSKKCRALERRLHLKILQKRKNELQSTLNNKSRKNRNLLRRQKSASNKTFEPIELQNDIVFDDDDDDEDDVDDHDECDEALQIDPNAITLPLIIDDSVAKPQSMHKSKQNESYASNISNLSADRLWNDMKHGITNSDESEVIIVVKEEEEDEEDEDEKEDNILEALQDVMLQANLHNNTTTHTTSGSNASSILESESDDISSDCFHLFDDDGAESTDVDHDDMKPKPKYTDCMIVPLIAIPKSEKELMPKVKPAYKHHLEMIDDDGTIAFQIQQRKKMRQKEKQQQHMKQLYSRQSNKRHHNHHTKEVVSYANINDSPLEGRSRSKYVRVYYFESKPLGFQINESPESISVTKLYSDRGTAFEKGIQKGWRIVQVNKQCGVKGMMSKLRNTDGPLHITFDTFAGASVKHYNKMI